MTELYCKKAFSKDFGWVLVPDENGLQDILKIKKNIYYRNRIQLPRNVKFHRLVMGNISHCYNNTEWNGSADSFRTYVLKKAAILGADTVEKFNTPDGTDYIVKSLAFDSMDETEFNAIWEPVATVLCDIMGYSNKDELYYKATEDLLQ